MRALYTEPALYRMLFDGWGGDLPFYRSLAAGVRGQILELGIGLGRVAIDLATHGHRVHGIEREPDMLRALEARLVELDAETRGRISFQRGDVTELALDGRFELVIAPFNGIAHQHGRDELVSFLRHAASHLTSDGRLAFDTWTPEASLLRGRVSDSPRFFDPRDGSPVRCTETVRHEQGLVTIELAVHHLDRDEPELLGLELRIVDPQELRDLLLAASLELLREEELGDLRGWVCRRART